MNQRRAALLAAALLFLSAAPALAALRPYEQRIKEIERILGDNRVRIALQQQPITRIELIGGDVFRVHGGLCRVDVRIVDLPPPAARPGWVGPRQFDLAVEAPVCQ